MSQRAAARRVRGRRAAHGVGRQRARARSAWSTVSRAISATTSARACVTATGDEWSI